MFNQSPRHRRTKWYSALLLIVDAWIFGDLFFGKRIIFDKENSAPRANANDFFQKRIGHENKFSFYKILPTLSVSK